MEDYTEISDFVLNQIYGYQDANEVKDNTSRLKDAISAEHTWSDTGTDADLGKHADGFVVSSYIGTGAVTIDKLAPSMKFSQFAGDGSDGSKTVNSNETIYVTDAGLQYTNFTIDATYTATLAASGANTRYEYFIGVTGTFTLNGSLSASGQGFPGGAAGDDSGADAGNGEPDIDDGFWLHGVGGSTGGAGGAVDSDNPAGDSGSGGNRFGQYAPGLAKTNGSPSDGDDGIDAIEFESWWRDPSAICAGTGGGGTAEAAPGVAPISANAGGNGGGLIYVEANAVVYGASAVIDTSGANGVDGIYDFSNRDGAGSGAGSGGDIVVITKSKTGTCTYLYNGGTGGTAFAGATPSGNGGDGGAARYHEEVIS